MRVKTEKELLLESITKTNETISQLKAYVNSLNIKDLTISESDYNMWKSRIPEIESHLIELQDKYKELE